MTFILEPLYKLTATVVGEHPKSIEKVLGEEFGVYLKSSTYSQDVKPLLKEVRPEEGVDFRGWGCTWRSGAGMTDWLQAVPQRCVTACSLASLAHTHCTSYILGQRAHPLNQNCVVVDVCRCAVVCLVLRQVLLTCWCSTSPAAR